MQERTRVAQWLKNHHRSLRTDGCIIYIIILLLLISRCQTSSSGGGSNKSYYNTVCNTSRSSALNPAFSPLYGTVERNVHYSCFCRLLSEMLVTPDPPIKTLLTCILNNGGGGGGGGGGSPVRQGWWFADLAPVGHRNGDDLSVCNREYSSSSNMVVLLL